MIRKTLLLFTVLSLFLMGCGEVGVEADISKDTEIDLTISNITSSGLVSLNATVNLAEAEFDEYLDDAENWIVNKIDIQITGVSGKADLVSSTTEAGMTASFDGSQLFTLGVSAQEASLFVDTQNNNALKTTDRIVVYDKNNPSNQQVPVNTATVDAIISALNARSTFQTTLDLIGEFENATINATVFVDVTLRTKID